VVLIDPDAVETQPVGQLQLVQVPLVVLGDPLWSHSSVFGG